MAPRLLLSVLAENLFFIIPTRTPRPQLPRRGKQMPLAAETKQQTTGARPLYPCAGENMLPPYVMPLQESAPQRGFCAGFKRFYYFVRIFAAHSYVKTEHYRARKLRVGLRKRIRQV